MIVIFFKRGRENTAIRIEGRSVYFSQVVGGVPQYTTIEGLKLNPATVVEEFPDLKGKPIKEIKKEAIKRFKEHIQTLESEFQVMNYLKGDLKKHGYKPLMYQKTGWRPIKFKDEKG